MYKDEQSSLQEVEKSDNKKHVEVLVFKRKADKALDRELLCSVEFHFSSIYVFIQNDGTIIFEFMLFFFRSEIVDFW